MKRLLTIVITAATLVSGCHSVNTKPEKTVENDTFFGTRVYYGSCIVRTQDEVREAAVLATIAGAIVPQLISTTLDRFGAALRKAGGKETKSFLGQLNFEDAPDKARPCIQIVRGNFVSSQAQSKPGSIHITDLGDDEANNRLIASGIYLAKEPQLFLELRVIQSKDQSALALAPTHLEYNALLATGKWYSSNYPQRGIATQLSFHAPGIKPDSGKAFGAPLVLGDFQVGTRKTFLSPKTPKFSDWRPDLVTAWFPHYGAKIAAASKTAKGAKPAGRGGGLPPRPFTLTATVTETRDANQFLLALADLFDTAKPILQTELEKLALKSKRKEAELSELRAESELSTNYYNALVESETKVMTYCEESQNGNSAGAKKDRLQRSKEARLSQLSTNIAALTAGLPQPYSKLITVSDGNVPGSCP